MGETFRSAWCVPVRPVTGTKKKNNNRAWRGPERRVGFDFSSLGKSFKLQFLSYLDCSLSLHCTTRTIAYHRTAVVLLALASLHEKELPGCAQQADDFYVFSSLWCRRLPPLSHCFKLRIVSTPCHRSRRLVCIFPRAKAPLMLMQILTPFTERHFYRPNFRTSFVTSRTSNFAATF